MAGYGAEGEQLSPDPAAGWVRPKKRTSEHSQHRLPAMAEQLHADRCNGVIRTVALGTVPCHPQCGHEHPGPVLYERPSLAVSATSLRAKPVVRPDMAKPTPTILGGWAYRGSDHRRSVLSSAGRWGAVHR